MYELLCRRCKAKYSAKSKEWRCRCGGPLNVDYISPFELSKQTVRFGPLSVWRYGEALPLNRSDNIVSFGEGYTPLVELEIKGVPVFLKMEFISLTGSFKDRGTTVMVSKMREIGVRTAVTDTSGNAGCSIAAYCARANIKCEIYVHFGAAKSKILQMQVCGAKVIRISGACEDVARAAMAAAEQHYFAGHAWNPYFLEGTKTMAFEIWEQLGWREPDACVIPVWGGTLLLGAYYGFKELLAAGKIRRMPKLYAVQLDAASPVYHRYVRSLEQLPGEPEKGGTKFHAAEEKHVWQPVRIDEVVQAVKDSDGTVLTVTDVEISEALRGLGKRGIYVEPMAAAAVSALVKLGRIGKISSNNAVVVPLTGSGFKATEKILRWVTLE